MVEPSFAQDFSNFFLIRTPTWAFPRPWRLLDASRHPEEHSDDDHFGDCHRLRGSGALHAGPTGDDEWTWVLFCFFGVLVALLEGFGL